MLALHRNRFVSWRSAIAALVLLGAIFLFARLNESIDPESLIQQNLLLLLPATLLISIAVLGWGLNWHFLLRGLGAQASPNKSLSLFLLTWLGRYVPGTIPYHAARVLAAESLGTDKAKVGASIAYETPLLLASGLLIGSLGLLVSLGLHSSTMLYLLAAAVVASLVVVLQPRVLVPLANYLLRVVRRPQISADALLSGRQIGVSLIGYAVAHVVNGLAFVLVLAALPGGDISPLLAVAAYTLAGVIGSAAIFVPSGIGVREGVVVGLLSSAIGPEQALMAAATARALSVVADLVPLAALGLVALLLRIRRLVDASMRRAGRGDDTAGVGAVEAHN
jgi:glycosyltransferase 2 family protein